MLSPRDLLVSIVDPLLPFLEAALSRNVTLARFPSVKEKAD
jgi:hypothetical protein